MLASCRHQPGIWAGTPDSQNLISPGVLTCTGDGSGDVRIRLATNLTRTTRFGGAIDNLQIRAMPDPAQPGEVEYRFSFGTFGRGEGEFNNPNGIAVDNLGKIYIADEKNGRIQVFDGAGTFQFAFGSAGWANGQFRLPVGVAADDSGNIYVTEEGELIGKRFLGCTGR